MSFSFEQIGLTNNEIEALKYPIKKTGWRLRFRKTNRFFSDHDYVGFLDLSEARFSEKIDTDASEAEIYKTTGDLPLIDGATLRAMIYDEKHNRTFMITNRENSVGNSDKAMAYIINHDIARAAAGHMEIISRDTTSGWDVGHTQKASSWAYDKKNEVLCLGYERNQYIPDEYPAIYRINVNKYLNDDQIDTCATTTVTLNPDYLKVTMWQLDTGTTMTSWIMKMFIAYSPEYRIYCWIAQPDNANDYSWFGYFDTNGAWNLLFYGSRWIDALQPYHPGEVICQSPGVPQVGHARVAQSTPFLGNVIDAQIIDGYVYFVADTRGTHNTGSAEFGFEYQILVMKLSEMNLIDQADYSAGLFGASSNTVNVPLTTVIGQPTKRYIAEDAEATASITDPCEVYENSWYKAGLKNAGYFEVTLRWTPTSIAGTPFYNEDITILVSSGYTCAKLSTPSNSDYIVGGKYQLKTLVYCKRGDNIKVSIVCGGDTGQFTYPNSVFPVSVFVRPYPLGLMNVIDVISVDGMAQITDPYRPEVAQLSALDYPSYHLPTGGMLAPVAQSIAADSQVVSPIGARNCDIISSKPKKKKITDFIIAVQNEDDINLGLHCLSETGALKILENGVDLAAGKIHSLHRVTDNLAIVGTNQYSVTAQKDYVGQLVTLKPFRVITTWNMTYSVLIAYGDTSSYNYDLIAEHKESEYDIRKWWDASGNDEDFTIGANGDVVDDVGQTGVVISPNFSEQKGQTSYQFSFKLEGRCYLPWSESPFNLEKDTTATYFPTLDPGTRIIVERWIQGMENYNAGRWAQEAQVFISEIDYAINEGFVDINVSCIGMIGTILSRSVYKFTHEPTRQIINGGIFTAVVGSGGTQWQYTPGGEAPYVDWLENPPPVVSINDVVTESCYINLTDGLVEFLADQTGNEIKVVFTHYAPDTNRAEDIIICILKHPQELGGAALDDSYFQRTFTNEAATQIDSWHFQLPKSNIVDGTVTIKVNDVVYPSDRTVNANTGIITFTYSQSGNTVTASATYYTIQSSGVSLPPISFTYDKYKSALDCVNEVCRRVAPNYIFKEDRDGKVMADFFTQKALDSEDITIEQSDVIIEKESDKPGYDALATRAISLGRAQLSDLPNLCFGANITDLWTYGWSAGTVANVIDNDPNTSVQAGFGRWGEGTYDVQSALGGDPDGKPMFRIDLLEVKDVKTIIVARGGGMQANEGDAGARMTISIWVSKDNSTWIKLIGATVIAPGGNQTFRAGTNFPESTRFQYIRLNMHSLGLYKWKGHTDSQSDISEVQCYESEILEGVAELQDTDPEAAHYDSWGLLAKFGFITSVARGGQVDDALNNQNKVDADASFTLDEIIRLVTTVNAELIHLPAVPIYSTMRIKNPVTDQDISFFVESRTASENGDSFTGVTLP